MSAFQDYYLAGVEEALGRKPTEAEVDEAKQLYVQGWHPRRTADHLAAKRLPKQRLNQPVVTPIGEGVFQGVLGSLALVRVKLTEETTKHLRDANCLTPRAVGSGLWTFDARELR